MASNNMGQAAFKPALDRVRESPPGQAPATDAALIGRAMDSLWRRIELNEDYVMSKDENALFTYFRPLRYSSGQNATIAQRAVAKYWGSPGQSNSS